MNIKQILTAILLTAATSQSAELTGTLSIEHQDGATYLAIQPDAQSRKSLPQIAGQDKIQIAGLSPEQYQEAGTHAGQTVSTTCIFGSRETCHHYTPIILITDAIRSKTTGSTKTTAKEGIADYFLRLPPSEFLEGTTAQLADRARRGEPSGLLDTKNGYMFVQGDGAQVSLQIALFRFPDGSPLLAVSYGDLEEPDFTKLQFFKEANGRMIPTQIPFPAAQNAQFTLPKIGRTIHAKTKQGTISATWKKDRFVQE